MVFFLIRKQNLAVHSQQYSFIQQKRYCMSRMDIKIVTISYLHNFFCLAFSKSNKDFKISSPLFVFKYKCLPYMDADSTINPLWVRDKIISWVYFWEKFVQSTNLLTPSTPLAIRYKTFKLFSNFDLFCKVLTMFFLSI